MSDLPPNESWRDIRPVALGILRRDDEVFLLEFHDDAAGETFYRPPGGGVEFGEPAAEAVVREFDEELGWEVTVTERLGVLENLFTYEGTRGHEYALVFELVAADESVYEREAVLSTETDGEEFPGRWKPLDAFRGDESPPLYPEGLLATLE